MHGSRFNLVLNTFWRPEIFIYIAFIFLTVAFFVLQSYAPEGSRSIVEHYLDLNSSRIVWTILLVFVALFVQGVVLYLRSAIRQVDPMVMLQKKTWEQLFFRGRVAARELVVTGIPFALGFMSLTLALGPLNAFNATRLRDELLFSWDVLFTGTFPALSLVSVRYPSWFVSATEFSFLYLVPVLTILGAYMLLTRSKLFREAAGAFYLSLIIMFIGWLVFPVLSPHDRFIDNVYNLPSIAVVEPYLETHQPQKEIVNFLEDMRETKKNLIVFPTTAIPSAHVVWGVFLSYYSWRIWKWLLLVTLPFATLSTLGTNLFAQHYFVDIPAGIITGIIAIFVVKWMRQKSDARTESVCLKQ